MSDWKNYLEQSLLTFIPITISEEGYFQLLHECSPYPFLVSEEGVCYLRIIKHSPKRFEYSVQPLVTHIKIVERIKNIETGEIHIRVEYHDGFHVGYHEFPRTVLAKNEIKQLLSLGIKFLESDGDMLLQYLTFTESSASLNYVHSSLGWCEIDGKPSFKVASLISPSNCTIPVSTYQGNLSLNPCGNLNTWLDIVRSEVIGKTPLTICLLCGFASPLLSYFGKKYDLGSLVFNLSNDSSRGKTTGAMLAVSIFSNPVLNSGTMRSFFATQNYLVNFLSQTSGLPVCLDEGATFSGDTNQLLYLLAGGSDKGRLNADSNMKPSLHWESVILTTAEFSLMEDTSPNGLRARCFPITEGLTSNAENADNIKKVVTENYGLAGPSFIQWLIDNKLCHIEADYLRVKNELIKKAENHATLTDRILSKLSVIVLTAQYVNECFQLNVDQTSIETYILRLEKKASSGSDPVQTFVDILMQEIGCNSARFLTADRTCVPNALGKIIEEDETKTIAVQKSWVELVCKKQNIQNVNSILTKIKGQGALETEKDRLTKRVRLNAGFPVQTCYIFQIHDKRECPDDITPATEHHTRKLKHGTVDLNVDELDF